MSGPSDNFPVKQTVTGRLITNILAGWLSVQPYPSLMLSEQRFKPFLEKHVRITVEEVCEKCEQEEPTHEYKNMRLCHSCLMKVQEYV